MTWREYHESTQHSPSSLRRSRHLLDWENKPDPFRHYQDVPVLDLPADPATPEIPALEVLRGGYGTAVAADGPTFLSQLLFHSAAISASKLAPASEERYALRVNPSSGNLHPTEFHFLTRGLKGWPDGLYHYRPSSHMAEQRAIGPLEMKLGDALAPLTFILTSIAWREAWKYRERAYRYCLHDMGHAWQALALAARAMECDSFATGIFPDDDVARFCRLSDDEWPMLVVEIRDARQHGGAIPVRDPDGGDAVWHADRPNQLSPDRIDYALIDEMHAATKLKDGEGRRILESEPDSVDAGESSGDIQLPAPSDSTRNFGEVARERRSALDFRGGIESMALAQLSAMLAVAAQPFAADFSTGFVQLYLYAHRVDGLEPGVYRYWPRCARLEVIRLGDQRVAAAGLSLGQDLAGNACVAFSMIADMERAARCHGDRGYRYAHFEAGAIGQRLYLGAEALGLGATGIGAFFDEKVQSYLNLPQSQGQVVVYHFAIGYPVPDPRVSPA